jgi:hypothetical protein
MFDSRSLFESNNEESIGRTSRLDRFAIRSITLDPEGYSFAIEFDTQLCSFCMLFVFKFDSLEVRM